MKRVHSIYFLLAVVLYSLSSLSAAGRRPLPAAFDGSMMPYDFAATDSMPVVPDSLRPVYIGYVARHGARYMTSPDKLRNLSKMLYDTALKSRLTPEGERFHLLIKKMEEAGAGKWGMLSDVGVDEERRLGADMARIFPDLFRKGEVNAVSSYVPRVVMTMYQFLFSLESNKTGINMSTLSGKELNPLLRCFHTDSIYDAYRAHGDWEPVYEEYFRQFVSPEPARRLLGAIHENDREKLRKITMQIYDVLSSCRAAGIEPPTDEFMTEAEYRGCWLADNLEHYLRNSVSPLSTSCAKATAPLIRRIISDADTALTAPEGKGRIFNGYFGHAETLLPLLSTMGVEGCFYLPLDYADLYKHWRVQEITPLGANYMIIFMKSESGRIYVSTRLNGRNISPLPDSPMTVPWNDLKEYWTARVEMLSNSPGADLP